MANNYFTNPFRYVVLSVSVFFSFLNLSASENGGWVKEFKPEKVFVENKGQFKIKEKNGFDSKVKYSYNGWHQFYHFTKSGVVFEFVKKERKDENLKEKEKEELEMRKLMQKGKLTVEEFKERENKERQIKVTKDYLFGQWIGANPNTEILAEDKAGFNQSFSYFNDEREYVHSASLETFKKLTYKNLYPNIDVVYELHPESGLKYTIFVRPGGDISQVKLKYSKQPHLLSNGEIKTSSIFGNILDHRPYTFYESSKSVIQSSYKIQGNVISFQLENYDATKSIVIDPWTQTPNFNTVWDCVWECERDAAGNAYLIGGIMPLVLSKYDPTGALQWSLNTPYDTSNTWLGSFATDNAGNSYVSEGTGGGVWKANSSGTVVYNNTSMGPFLLTEYWSISFNCDQTKLVIGGTGGTGIIPQPYIYNVNPANGNITGNIQVTGGALFPTQEVRSIAACKNGKYYFLSHDSIGYIHQGFNSCVTNPGGLPFHVGSSYGLSYKCENWRDPAANSGIAAIKYFNDFIYTHKGTVVHKRAFSSGAILATGNITGGGFASSQVQNSGIDIDTCGNVYVGSKNQVIKFDQNLNQIATYPTSFNVYDVVVSTSGNIIVAGSTGTNSSGARTGYIQQISAGACNIITPICCDATICSKAPLCVTAAAVTLTAYTPGGTWSGNGITNASSGAFDPAIAGVGVHTIRYTLACGSDSINITVNSCTATSVCKESNGTYTISGGTGPYTWSRWDSTGRACVGGIVFLGNCTGTWQKTLGWAQFATGTNVTFPVGEDSIKVVDNSGTTLTYNGAAAIAAIPPCSACPTITVSSSNIINENCNGQSIGSFTGSASGGTGPYTFVLKNGGTTVSTFNNVASTQNFTALAAATYTLQVTDANSCSGTATVIITQPNVLSVTIPAPTPASCGSNNGGATANVTGGTTNYTYLWTGGGNAATNSSLGAGSYTVTVTDSKGCTATATTTIANSGGPTVTSVKTDVLCNGGNTGKIVVTATGGSGALTYTWSPNVSTSDTAKNLLAGVYNVTVKDASNCASSATVTVTESSAITVTATPTATSCGGTNGSVVANASGGTGTLIYTWSTGGSGASLNNIVSGTYTVTVKDANLCSVTASANVGSSGGPSLSAAKTDLLCNAAGTGSVTITVTGGTGTLTYTWSPNVSSTNTANGLAAGTYRVTVIDGSNCTSTTSVTVTEPSAITATTSSTQANCGVSDGSVSVNALGGTGTLGFTWSTGSNAASVNTLPAGNYTVTVTDANLCTAVRTASISNFGAPTVLHDSTDVTCNGGSNGTITFNVSGGTSPYQYNWSPNVSSGATASGLIAGTYNATISDAANCLALFSININQPQPVSVSIQTTVASCGLSNGTATATATGGTGTLSYQWSNLQSGASISGLAGGPYTVTVTDASLCTASQSTNVTNTAAPNAPTISGPVSFCQGDSATLTSSATTGNLWNNGVTTQTITVKAGGTFNVTQTVNGCTSPPSSDYTVTEFPNPVVQILSTKDTLCANDVSTLSVFNTPATYLWSTNEQTASIVVQSPGSYFVSVTENGCNGFDKKTIYGATSVVNFNLSDSTLCLGETIALNAQQANAKSYLWNNGARTPIITVTTAGTYVVQVTGSCNVIRDTVFISFESCGCDVAIPTAFSPNGDGINDLYGPIYNCVEIKSVAFRLFNRWGEKVFETKDIYEKWDGIYKGVPQPLEVYIYYLDVDAVENNKAKSFRLMGNVTLVR